VFVKKAKTASRIIIYEVLGYLMSVLITMIGVVLNVGLYPSPKVMPTLILLLP